MKDSINAETNYLQENDITGAEQHIAYPHTDVHIDPEAVALVRRDDNWTNN